MMMRRIRPTAATLLGLGLLVLAGCAGQATPSAPQAQIPTLGPGMARVWFLRQADPPAGNLEAARPMIYANGAPIAESKEGTAFFHDFPPGAYKFKVQPYGTPTGESDRLQLAAGMQTYLQVQAVPNWEQGSPVGGWSFALLTMSPQLAQQYMPTMTNLGRR
jgi:hypothetical protein